MAFEEMLFFDDARDGKYGNCVPVAEMGVQAVHCPTGLHDEEVFEIGLARFREWDRSSGTIVEWDGAFAKPYSVDHNSTERFEGQVTFVNEERGFGFILLEDRSTNDLFFFHFSSLPAGQTVDIGDKLKFSVERDPKTGKSRACDVEILTTADDSTGGVAKAITVHAFR